MIHIATCVLQGKSTNLLSVMQIVKVSMIHIATCVLQGKSTNLLSVMQIVKEYINDTYSYMCSTR